MGEADESQQFQSCGKFFDGGGGVGRMWCPGSTEEGPLSWGGGRERWRGKGRVGGLLKDTQRADH